MALSIGIVGLPNVGKSTLFTALTDQTGLAANYPFATIDPNVGIVPVPDERLEKLAEIAHPGRIVPATVEFVDIAGLVKGASEGEGLGNQFLANIRETDAICEVVRYFSDPDVIRHESSQDPTSDIETIRTELVLADLATLEKVLVRLEKEAKRDKANLPKYEMAKRVEERPFDIMDINMGCPVPKVVRNGEGSALMKNPKLVYEIVSAMVKAIDKPVTVKIRKGFDDSCINAVEIAKIVEEAGAAAVAVHGRTREQYYSGQADWDIIRQVKEAVSIPVIGNGDVTSPQKAEELVKQTGCDGIMIARGAQGNPWIFSEMITYEETGTLPERPGKEEVRDMMLRHARLQLKYKGEFIGIREMRKHVAWYTKGLKGSAKLREEINRVESYQELEELLFQRL